MQSARFLGLEPTDDPTRWRMDIEPGVATAGRFLFGGCGLGAAACAMEAVTGRRLVWATAQYLSFAMVGETIDVEVTIATEGHHTTQARVVGKVADREILTVNAALGSRPLPWEGQWAVMPTVPEPEMCERRASRWDVTDTIMERMDFRLATGRQWEEMDGIASHDGRSASWVRLHDLDMSAVALTILGDYVPFGIAQALGRWTLSSSLDNTLRIVKVVPTEWVLLDIRIDGVAGGFGHGLVHLWAQDGTLLATASQSSVIRELDPPGR